VNDERAEPAVDDERPDEPEPDPELEAFDAVCQRLAGFDARLDTEWVDGFLTAVAASWRAIPIDEWLPALAGEAFERAFGDPEDVAQAMSALARRCELLRQALDPAALFDEPDTLRLAPFMIEWSEEARARLLDEGLVPAEDLPAYRTGVLWAEGFFDALDAFEADWPAPDPGDELAPAHDEAIDAITALAQDPDDEELKRYLQAHWPDGEPTREELIDDALFAVQDLRIWWVDHAPKGTPRRVGAQPGRNDPCPCGSGRKFKKCHGAGA